MQNLISQWRARAALLREHAHESTARAYETCAQDLERALAEDANTLLNLQEAAAASGYSADHLGRLVREGKIPNRGRRGAPRVRKADLPKKAEAAGEGSGSRADAVRRVLGRDR